MYLSDDELVTTNENGELQKRDVEANDMRGLLESENKLEIINNMINEIENELENLQKVIPTQEFIQKRNLLLSIELSIIGGVLISVATFPFVGLITPAYSFWFLAFICTFIVVETLSYQFIIKKVIKQDKEDKILLEQNQSGLTKKLEKASELKATYEKEIESFKTNHQEQTIPSTKLEIVSLTDSTEFLPRKDENKLDIAYEEGYKSTQKQLVLKRKNNVHGKKRTI